MITNLATNKLKASKSSRDLVESNKDFDSGIESKFALDKRHKNRVLYLSDDNLDYQGPLSTIVICPKDRPESRLKPRPRLRDDFRTARGGHLDRRGRGRGGPRKMEREDSAYIPRGKFQESLNKSNSDSGHYSSSKHYDNENSKSRNYVLYMVPEDSRISKLLRKLSHEDNIDKFLTITQKLQESIMSPDNNRYIRRSFDMISDSLFELLHTSPCLEAKIEISKCIGRTGYTLEQDYKRFMDWIFSILTKEHDVQVKTLLLKSFFETFKLEAENPKLKEFSTKLMSQLQNILENTDQSDILMVIVDVIISFTDLYPLTFTSHFRDTVDILVGWHIDSNQPHGILKFASQSLQRLKKYWVSDIEFSLTLLNQFLEDIELYVDDLLHPTSGRSSPEEGPPLPDDCLKRISSFLKVFNTVLKCLGQHLNPANTMSVEFCFLIESYSKILKAITKSMDHSINEDILASGNQSAFILLSYLQNKSSSANELLYKYISKQLKCCETYSDFGIISLFKLISKMIRETSANLPLNIIQILLEPGSIILMNRFSQSQCVQKEVIQIFHSLLNLKNIPLLQEAYRYVLGDLEKAYKILVPSLEELCSPNPHAETTYAKDQVENVIIFYLHGLSDLANASNSIIAIWALKPTIFELLALKLLPNSDKILNKSSLYHSLVYLLYSLCSRSNHFVSSSDLVNSSEQRSMVCDLLGISGNKMLGHGPASSPTSRHLEIILKLVTTLLLQNSLEETKLLLLKWTRELIGHAQPYLENLASTETFQNLVFTVLNTAHQYSSKPVVLSVLNNAEQLLLSREIKYKSQLMIHVVEVSKIHLNSNSSAIRIQASKLLNFVPCSYSLVGLRMESFVTLGKANKSPFACTPRSNVKIQLSPELARIAQRHHFARGTCGEIQPLQFRVFMSYLLQNNKPGLDDWLPKLFNSSYPQLVNSESKSSRQFALLGKTDRSVTLMWICWETAAFCVRNKLRTPIGKALDTLTSIEGAIKKFAKQTTNFHNSILNNNQVEEHIKNKNQVSTLIESNMSEQLRARILLEFVEHLERACHNASEGCATAMLPPSKPVRTFFHTNKSTCQEWLSRIRMGVIIVALHAGNAPAAIRQGQLLLQGFVDANNTQSPDFEKTLMYVCWALCKLKEPESISGLYTWSKEVSGKKFLWLKAALDYANNRFEMAAENFYRLITAEITLSPLHNTSLPFSSSNDDLYEMTDILKPLVKISERDSLVIPFMVDQIIECYRAVNNWTALRKWKERENEIWGRKNGKTNHHFLLNSIDNSYIQAMEEYEQNDLQAASKLMNWPSEEKSLFNNKSWSVYSLLNQANSNLTKISLKFKFAKENNTDFNSAFYEKSLSDCLYIADCHIRESVRHPPSEFLQDSIILKHMSAGLLNLMKGEKDDFLNMLDLSRCSKFMNSSNLTQIMWWCQYFSGFEEPKLTEKLNLKLLKLETVKLARKENNFLLAKKFILQSFDVDEMNQNKLNLEEFSRNLLTSNTDNEITYIDIFKLKSLKELSKLLFAKDQVETAVNVASWTSLTASQQLNINPDRQLNETNARILMNLAKWLQQDTRINESFQSNYLEKLVTWQMGHNDSTLFHFLDVQTDANLTPKRAHVIPSSDVRIGQLLQLSVNQCPSLAKTWSQFGSWCYRWAHRVVDVAANDPAGQLTEEDRLQVQQLIPDAPNLNSDLESIYSILSQARSVITEDEIDSLDVINTCEMIENQLQNIPSLNGASSETLSKLVNIWRQVQKRVYRYYELSAIAYFKYLELSGSGESEESEGYAIITSTLRLLRLIVKYALELQTVLEAGLGATPIQPWKCIIPQLFSRLNHPEPYVRRRVSELLCRVAQDAPHLITFPAVVGADSGGVQHLREDMNISSASSRLFNTTISEQECDPVDGDVTVALNADDDDEEEDDEDCFPNDESQQNVLKNCFLAMVDTLSNQTPEAISQVQLLVRELKRITLLWDELWLGTLLQHHAEISRRLGLLETEVAKVDANESLSTSEKDTLIAEKHRIILQPLIFLLEQLNSISSVNPETPHEIAFQEKFSEPINKAIDKLKNPTNPRKPQESLQLLKQLQAKLQQRAQKRIAYTLKMSDISPAIFALKNTCIAMPGVSKKAGQIISISSVENHIAILPTKTKPKKLVFHGSDGKLYTYLFKGLEDLHLDERIMQFLGIANTMMARSSRGSTHNYCARHYSVIPLGPRSGLIRWVDGVTPLFSLYKRWQQREATIPPKTNSNNGLVNQSGTSISTITGNNTAQILRPSDLFYNKLTPLLKEHGIAVENRKEWPLNILRKVLTELMEETPRDLLAKELWCHSINAGDWWETTRNYSCSVAVMSIIGYIIGLGDRHLDNVLVDLTTGEVVHIDYNVCFEKGKTLRVPEKVPFRMTANIRTALGVTGVEGPFRLACEHVLKVMRRGRETLLTLLEAFVYDPLIDWTLGNETGYTGAVYGGDPTLTGEARLRRREMERELTLAMFRVRIAEMRGGWIRNRNDILESLPTLETLLNQWLETERQRRYWDDAIRERALMLSIVQEAITFSKNNTQESEQPHAIILQQHALLTLPNRWTQFRHARDTREKIRLALTEKTEECEKHLAMFKAALNTVRGPQMSQWLSELNYPIPKDSHMVFDLVKEFLQNAGQAQTIVQCEQSENELEQISQQHITIIRNTFELLSRYGSIAGLYPASYINNHRSVCYSRWAQLLNNNISIESCSKVVGEFHSIFSPDCIVSTPLSQQLATLAYQLQTSLAESNSRYTKSLERYTNEGLPDTAGRLESSYSEARSALIDMQHTDPSSTLALQCVNITALCALNKRLLIIETAALSAGDCLVDLTSREGDWFLDEMYLVSTLITELSTNLGLFQTDHSDPQLQLLLHCLQSEHTIYKSLQELNYNFYTIILPETAKTIQTEEPSVLAMIAELNEVITSLGLPVTDLLAQLEMHLHYVIMEMPSNHQGAQGLVAILRKKYESLLCPEERESTINSSPTEESLTAGQMLLMGFNGLFEKLHIEGATLISALDTLNFPAAWKKVDHVRDAKKLAAAMLNEATRSVLDDIFLLKRLATIQEFFALCTQMAHRGAFFNDSDRLSKPVRRFTADYVARRFLGVTSHTMALTLCLLLQQIGLNVTMEVESQDIGAESKVSLEELCHKAVESCLKRGRFDSSILSQASALMSTLESTWRRREVARHLQQELEIQRSTVQRLQLQLTAFHWLHEDALLLLGIALTNMAPLNRPAFMLELRKASASLLALQPRLTEALEQQSSLVTSIGQRLKWAAGANPALNEVLAAFESSVSAIAERLNLEQRLAAIARNTCNAIIYHEALRTRTNEALTNDTSFLKLVEQCEQMMHLLVNSTQVTPMEERLVQLVITSDPLALENSSWLSTKAEPLLSDYETLTSFSKHIESFKENISQIKTSLKSQVHLIRNQLGTHHKLISEVRNLFKSISKIEYFNFNGLNEYLCDYRSYCEDFSNIIKDLHSEDFDVDKIEEYIKIIKRILGQTTNIYDGLLKFAETSVENNKNKRPPLTRQESICLSPRKGLPNNVTNNKRDPQTGKAIQERNTYALGVWRRVRMKLEGRDPDSVRRSSTQEQVDFVIREATSLDNLALLYEGWTPWV